MTYTYATKQNSPVYHIVEKGRTYALCGIWVRTGKDISSEPPAWKRECKTCAEMLREQTDKADLSKS